MDTDLRDTVRAIEDDLGMDCYMIFQGDKRRFAIEAIIVHLILAFLATYVVTLFGAKELAERHRKYILNTLMALRQRLMSMPANTVNVDAENDELIAAIGSATANLLPQETEQAFSDIQRSGGALQELEKLLIEFGLPEPRAKDHAKRIEGEAKRYLIKKSSQSSR